MRIPFYWLKELVDIKLSAQEIADKVTMAGLETTVIETTKEGEPILEVDILPNRGDCNSVLGTAREVSAVVNSKVKSQKSKIKEGKKKVASVLKVEVRDKNACPRYMARVVENVSVKESPKWLKDKLTAAGSRPINNVVDVTNYLLLERGQPMHAFDYDLLEGHKIIVRRAAPKEEIKTLDNEKRSLENDVLVIADANKAIAVAGIMGGANTEVTLSTKTVVLESACFDPIGIAKSSKFLKLRTESSARFEKTVDPDIVEEALDHAAAMIAELSGGDILSGKIDIRSKKTKKPVLSLNIEKLNSILGIKITSVKAAALLKRLGFKIIKHDFKKILVLVPSWRISDIEREIDLIEEVARINGYNNVPATSPKIRRREVTNTAASFVSKIKDILIGTGLYEVQTFSLVDPNETVDESIKITNPMSISESAMRTSLLPSILRVVSHNLRRQVEDIGIFEVGKVFKKKGSENLVLAGAITWPKAGFSDVKGIVEALINEFYANYKTESIVSDWYNPSRSCAIIIENRPIAKLGLFHPDISKKFDITKDTYIFEIDIESLINLKPAKKHTDLPRYPKVDRDIAMFVPDGITYDQIVTLIKESAGMLLEEVKLFDIYKNSQAYRLSFRDKNTTLTDEIVNEKFFSVIKTLEGKLGVTIRKS